jgi:ribosomal protein S18 acetylase RimI-like enzyme
MSAFSVRPATTADAPAIAAIYAQTLYDGSFSVAEVRDGMRQRQGAYFVAVAAGIIIAAGNVTYASPRSVLDSANVGMRAAQRRILAAAGDTRRIGGLENVGVLPAWRGRGVARALVSARLDWLREHGAGFVHSWGWKTPKGCHIEKTLIASGFKPLAEVPDFYLRDGLAKDYTCPFCGPHCHCSAILFVASLS